MGLFDKDLVEKEIYISYAEGSKTIPATPRI